MANWNPAVLGTLYKSPSLSVYFILLVPDRYRWNCCWFNTAEYLEENNDICKIITRPNNILNSKIKYLLILIIQSICGVLLTISGVLYIAWFNDYIAILIGRLIGGFVHGILYMTIVSHYAENSVAQMRGRIVSNIGIVLNGSAVLFTLFNYFDWEIFNMESSYSVRLIGIFVLLFAVLGLILNYFLTVESVQFLMDRDQKHEAITILMKLRNETPLESKIISREIQQIEQMINLAHGENQNIFKDENIRPLIAIIIVKVIAFLANNAIINTMIVRSVQVKVEDHTMLYVAPLVYACSSALFHYYVVII